MFIAAGSPAEDVRFLHKTARALSGYVGSFSKDQESLAKDLSQFGEIAAASRDSKRGPRDTNYFPCDHQFCVA